MSSSDSEFVRHSIWEHVQEARPFITELEREELELTNDECSDQRWDMSAKETIVIHCKRTLGSFVDHNTGRQVPVGVMP
jgi:hypothetical protein